MKRWLSIGAAAVAILSVVALMTPVLIGLLEPPILYGAEIHVDTPTLRAEQAIPITYQICVWEPFNSTGVLLSSQVSIRRVGAAEETSISQLSESLLQNGCRTGRQVAYRLPDVVEPGYYIIEAAIILNGRWRKDVVTIRSQPFEVIS